MNGLNRQMALDLSSKEHERFALLRGLNIGKSQEASRIRFLLEIVAGVAGCSELTWTMNRLAERMSLPKRTLYKTIDLAERLSLIKRRATSRPDGSQSTSALSVHWDAIIQRSYLRVNDVESSAIQSQGQCTSGTGQCTSGTDLRLSGTGQCTSGTDLRLSGTPYRNKELNTGSKAPGGRPADLTIPPELDLPPFPAAWSEWLAYRRERRLSSRDRTLRAQLTSLAPLGPIAAAECLHLSIRNGWQGLFPERMGSHGRASSNVRRAQRYRE